MIDSICRLSVRIEATKYVLLFMARKFKFTPSFSLRTANSRIQSDTILSKDTLETKDEGEVWLSYGFSLSTYRMIVFQQDISHSLTVYRVDGMLNPFTCLIWVLLFTSSFSSAAILAKTCDSIKNYISHVFKVWFGLLLMLLLLV